MHWATQSVESNCGALLWKLRTPRPREVIVDHVGMTSEHVGIKSNPNLTVEHCAMIGSARDRLLSNELSNHSVFKPCVPGGLCSTLSWSSNFLVFHVPGFSKCFSSTTFLAHPRLTSLYPKPLLLGKDCSAYTLSCVLIGQLTLFFSLVVFQW